MKPFVVLFLAGLVFVLGFAAPATASSLYFARFISTSTIVCGISGGEAFFGYGYTFEYNLPTGDGYVIITRSNNGTPGLTEQFDPTTRSGTANSTNSAHFPVAGFPFFFEEQLITIVGGDPVDVSSLRIDCTDPGTPLITISGSSGTDSGSGAPLHPPGDHIPPTGREMVQLHSTVRLFGAPGNFPTNTFLRQHQSFWASHTIFCTNLLPAPDNAAAFIPPVDALCAPGDVYREVYGVGTNDLFFPLFPGGELPPSGDFSSDGTASAADFELWKANFGRNVPLFADGDFNGDGTVDAGDYVLWRGQVGG
jgi:hypothetical protein